AYTELHTLSLHDARPIYERGNESDRISRSTCALAGFMGRLRYSVTWSLRRDDCALSPAENRTRSIDRCVAPCNRRDVHDPAARRTEDQGNPPQAIGKHRLLRGAQ